MKSKKTTTANDYEYEDVVENILYGNGIDTEDNEDVVESKATKKRKKKIVTKEYDYRKQKVAYSSKDGHFMSLKAFEDYMQFTNTC